MKEFFPSARLGKNSFLRLGGAAEDGLGGGEAGDWDSEGGAADVVQAHLVEEGHRRGVAAVLAADADLQVGLHGAAALHGQVHQGADACFIQRHEGVRRVDAALQVGRQEAAGVVPRQAERGLRQVVGPEAEELRLGGDLARGDARPRQLDHRPQAEGDLLARRPQRRGHLLGLGAQDGQLLLLRRAEESDFNALLEAKVYGSTRLYDEVFQILLQRDADGLANFVTRNGLLSNAGLVELSAKKLSENPNLDNLLKFVHLSALTNSAEIFLQTLETTKEIWNEKRLNEISDEKLIEILDSHYWLLASEARVSGAGYLLKEKMASVRQEILGK